MAALLQSFAQAAQTEVDAVALRVVHIDGLVLHVYQCGFLELAALFAVFQGSHGLNYGRLPTLTDKQTVEPMVF